MCSVVEAIQEEAVRERLSRVQRVSLAVGQFCNVEVEALAFCFDIVARGTIVEGACLDIVAVPGEGCCQRCRNIFRVSSRGATCPSCGAWDVVYSGGDQIVIRELEVE
jgi:hydrogenase nickel incorporation protein HypA/HybF